MVGMDRAGSASKEEYPRCHEFHSCCYHLLKALHKTFVAAENGGKRGLSRRKGEEKEEEGGDTCLPSPLPSPAPPQITMLLVPYHSTPSLHNSLT